MVAISDTSDVNQIEYGPVFDDDLRRINLPADKDGTEHWVDVLKYVTEDARSEALDAAKSYYRMGAAGNRQQKRQMKKDGAGEDTEFFFNTGSYQRALLQQMVKAWSFTRGGIAIPVTPDTVAKLPQHTRELIMEQVDAFNTTSKEEDTNLENASSPSSPETENAQNNFEPRI